MNAPSDTGTPDGETGGRREDAARFKGKKRRAHRGPQQNMEQNALLWS